MSRKRPIPGVDEAALAALAGQFPSGSLRAIDPPVQAPPVQDPPVQDNVPLALGEAEIRGLQSVAPSGSEPAPRKASGRGLAAVAMLVALLALLTAAIAVMPPPARVWLSQNL